MGRSNRDFFFFHVRSGLILEDFRLLCLVTYPVYRLRNALGDVWQFFA